MTAPAADRVYLGWQYAAGDRDPGPPPRRPTPPPHERVSPDWVAAQRSQERRLGRPVRAVCGLAVTALLAAVVLGMAGALSPVAAVAGAAGAALVAAVSANALRQGRAALRARLEAEHLRVRALRADSEQRLFLSLAEHASQVLRWRAAMAARAGRPCWYAVTTPAGIRRADLAGGTLAGWSALVTMAGAYRLAAGGAVTVLDLTQSCVAFDLLAFAQAAGHGGEVLVLPRDLPGLDLGAGPGGGSLADVLAVTAAAADGAGSGDHVAGDTALLRKIADLLGDTPAIASVIAALRVLARVGDPADDIAAGLLTGAQADRLRVLFGPDAAGRVVAERAWALESRLSILAGTGTAPVPAPGPGLRVVALDRDCGVRDSRVLAAYLAAVMSHRLRDADAAAARRHLVLVLGADGLPGELFDRLSDACEGSGTGLLLGYRSIDAQVAGRLGRGDAAVVYMRLGNARDARAASEQLGTEHRFVVSQLTETVGLSITDTTGGSYTSTAGQSASVSASESASRASSRSAGRGQAGPALAASGGSRSTQRSDGQTTGQTASVSAGLSASTSWGRTTSLAAGTSASAGHTAQRSRELLLEQHELQQLPPSAMIVTYAGPAGREVIFADANPAIGSLPGASLDSPAACAIHPDEIPALPGEMPALPNLGPPPPRLDWR